MIKVIWTGGLEPSADSIGRNPPPNPAPAFLSVRPRANSLPGTTPMPTRNPRAFSLATVLFLVAANNLAWGASPFPDKNLETAVRADLKLEPKEELTDEKLLNLYFLEAPGKEIKDLTGLEKCKNLALINLHKNQVAELKALKDLANVQSLDLSNNAIKDLTPLAGLKGLQYLEISGNKIESLAPLKGLVNLTSLYLAGNAVKDLAPLEPLVKLASLSAGKNQIKDIKVLEKVTRIGVLDLSDNQIADASPLAKQTELRILMIQRNQIKDLAPFVAAAKADAAGPKRYAPYLRLYIEGNPLSDAAKKSQLGALKDLGARIEG